MADHSYFTPLLLSTGSICHANHTVAATPLHMSDPHAIRELSETPYTTVLMTPIRFKWMLIA